MNPWSPNATETAMRGGVFEGFEGGGGVLTRRLNHRRSGARHSARELPVIRPVWRQGVTTRERENPASDFGGGVFGVERTTGFEPATPTLARLCATSCATSAYRTVDVGRTADALRGARRTIADGVPAHKAGVWGAGYGARERGVPARVRGRRGGVRLVGACIRGARPAGGWIGWPTTLLRLRAGPRVVWHSPVRGSINSGFECRSAVRERLGPASRLNGLAHCRMARVWKSGSQGVRLAEGSPARGVENPYALCGPALAERN
ncbi:hypothetical protein GCM10023353_21500 [Tomitella cavernea]|uniref:Uncharacterized protein n=1 Tax=Tomitella cavernea TaxID=1387982 RepID=A0ABP9CVW5_9ACTN